MKRTYGMSSQREREYIGTMRRIAIKLTFERNEKEKRRLFDLDHKVYSRLISKKLEKEIRG